ncbi:MAG: hypothetical protein Q4B27_05030 [Candidatus Saccharibacteria bacterium]|nr:hypothetical protein [Candidatus Saccharibacteria bacterium]
MNNDNWEPLSVRRSQRQPFTPVDGVPDFLWQYAMRWIESALNDDTSIVCGLSIDLRLEHAGNYLEYQGASYAIRACLEETGHDQYTALDVIDWLLGHGFGQAEALEYILKSAGHVLRVSPDGNRLVERIEPALWNEYEQVTQPDDQASQYMQEAWSLAFGREPNLSDAWGRAIKAIETLLKPIVSPKNDKATIGSMASVLRQAPDKWKCKLPDREYKANGKTRVKPGIEVFIDVIATIGYQPDRHGGDQQQDVDENTARSVLLLATTVVGWLRDGALVLADEPLTSDK